MQRLALFDLDGTLVDRQGAFHDAVTALCESHKYGRHVQAWLLAELADRAVPADFDRLRRIFGLLEPAAYLWQEYVERMAARVTCRPAVLDGLAQLRGADWTVGIVTNGAADIQRAKLVATGIGDLINGVAVSGDLEVRKPDRRLFVFAAARCGRDLSDGGWLIGDNPAGDIAGGHRAGLRTIWLRGRPWPNVVRPPHHVVDDVVDAIDILLNDINDISE